MKMPRISFSKIFSKDLFFPSECVYETFGKVRSIFSIQMAVCFLIPFCLTGLAELSYPSVVTGSRMKLC